MQRFAEKTTACLTGLMVILVAAAVSLCLATEGQTREVWRYLEKGVEYGVFPVYTPAEGRVVFHVVRLDPGQVRLKLILASERDKKSRTAGGWCRDFNLVAAINAGMYQGDYLTNVGYLRNGSYVQNKYWHRKHKSALAFGPRKIGLPAAIIMDLDERSVISRLNDFDAVVQNLRLMRCDGVGVWTRSEKKWSEAAAGMDRAGRILFLFCREPMTMKRFNETVRSLDLNAVCLMHLEGGPLASLSIRTERFSLDLAGSYENMVPVNGGQGEQWPIPNVIGVQVK